MTEHATPGVPWFTSGRERRLWIWTMVVVAAIYSTLGLSSTLVASIDEQDLQAAVFVLGAFLVVAATVALARNVRLRGSEIGVMLGVLAVYMLVFVRVTSAAERSHLIEYGVVAVFVYEALQERSSQGRRIRSPALLATAITVLVGVVDELIQIVVPSRVFDPIDILFNTLAAVLAVGASVLIGRVRRRNRSSRTWPGDA